MHVFLGAVIGGVVSIVLMFGLWAVSTVIPLLGLCNCCCCLWPLVGGALGAAFAVRKSPEGGGAGKGAATGALSGVVGGTVLSVVYLVVMASLWTMLPQLWGGIRGVFSQDQAIDNAVKDIRDDSLHKHHHF